MRVFKTKSLARFANRERIGDTGLTEAIARAERGLVDADLTGGLIKQRIARQGSGRRGGYRALVAFRKGDLAVFMFGFAKNDRDNIGPDELTALRLIGRQWLGDDSKIVKDLAAGILIEVKS